MTGYSRRTWSAASRPICTSCCGEYLFFGGVTRVCAARVETSRTTRRVARASGFIFAFYFKIRANVLAQPLFVPGTGLAPDHVEECTMRLATLTVGIVLLASSLSFGQPRSTDMTNLERRYQDAEQALAAN